LSPMISSFHLEEVTGRAYLGVCGNGMLSAFGVCCENQAPISQSSGRINPALKRLVAGDRNAPNALFLPFHLPLKRAEEATG